MTTVKSFKKGEFQIGNLLNDHTNGLVIISGKLVSGLIKQGDTIQINHQRLEVLLLEVTVGNGSNIILHVSMSEFNRSEYSKIKSKIIDVYA